MLRFNIDTSKGETPQSIAQKRALIAQLMGSAKSPQNLGEGFSAIGDGIVANVLSGRAADAESKGQESADSTFSALTGMLTGQGGQTPSTGTAGGFANTGAGGPNAYRDAIASIESAGSGDYGAIGPTNDTLGRALGRYQVMEANIGPWSREALGREVSPDEFLANPDLQDAIFDHRFGSYVDQFGPEGAAQAWFAGPGGVGKMDRRDVLGTSVSAYTDKFNNALGGAPVQVASLDPSIGAPAQLPPIGPSGGPPLTAMPQQTAQAAPMAAPAPQQAAPAPVQTAQGPSLAQLMEAAANPFLMANPGMAATVNAMLAQEMQKQDPRYAMELQAGQIGLEKSQLELEAMRNPARKTTEINGRLVYEDTGELVADYSDPNTAIVGNDVIDLGTGQPIYQGQPEPTSDMQNYDAYAADEISAGRQPVGRMEYEQAIRASGATNITNNLGGTDEFYKKLDTDLGAQQVALIDAGMTAQSNNMRLGQLEQHLANAPQGAQGALVQFAGSLGLPVEGASDVQAAQAIINQMVPGQRPPGSGTMSDADLALFKQSLPSIMNQPGGNAAIISTTRAINEYTIKQAEIARMIANREVKPEEGRAMQAAIPNPLAGFKPPASDMAPNQSQAPAITSQEQYDALPSGSPYKAPDGSIRTKR